MSLLLGQPRSADLEPTLVVLLPSEDHIKTTNRISVFGSLPPPGQEGRGTVSQPFNVRLLRNVYLPLPLQDLPAQGLGTLAGAHDFVIDHPIFTSIITKSRALFMDRHTPIQEGPVADIFRGPSI